MENTRKIPKKLQYDELRYRLDWVKTIRAP
jgi:hypothetical protein